MKKPRLLVTGASGFIGGFLRQKLAADWEILGTCLKQDPGPSLVRLDLTDFKAVDEVFEGFKPQAVVHTAAISDPDVCEKDPVAAWKLNRDAVGHLAQIAGRDSIRLIHFSTDLVFDGTKTFYTEEDAPRPLSVYGKSKLEAEKLLMQACPQACALRVATVYGRSLGSRPSFVDTLYEKFSRGEKLKALVDQWRTATPCLQLPGVVCALLKRREIIGIYHWGGADRLSRMEFSKIFCRVFGFSENLLEPIRMQDMSFLAARPQDTSLDSSQLSGILGIPLCHVERGMRELKKQWLAP